MEELRRLAFEGVANELKDPAEPEQGERQPPETMGEESRDKYGNRKKNRGDTESVAEAIHRVLVTGGVSRDPLLAGASA